MKALVQGTLGRWPFQEPWKQFVFDQQAHIEAKHFFVGVWFSWVWFDFT